MNRTHRITTRLLIGFLLLSPLPLGGLSWFYMQQFEQTLHQDELEKFSAIADKKYNQINTYLNERLSDSRMWAASPVLIEALQTFSTLHENVDSLLHLSRKKSYQDYIDTLRLKESGYRDLMLTDTAGRVVFSTRREANPDSNLNSETGRNEPLTMAHRAALSTGATQITPASLYPPSGNRYAIFIVSPILKAGQTIGTLDLQLDIGQFAAVTSDATGMGKTGATMIAQPQGKKILFIGQSERFPDGKYFHTVSPDKLGKPMQAALSGVSGQGPGVDYSGTEVVGAWRYLPALHWGMVVKANTAEAFAPLYRLQKSLAIALASSLLLAGLVAVLFGRTLVAPIRKLIAATGQIAEGDLSHRAPVIGWMELQQLAISFNRMAEHLQTSYTKLETQVARRTADLEKAEAANHSKNLFLSSMSHELRTPLNAILGYAQLMQLDTDLPAQAIENAGEIHRAGDHLLSLLNDVLDLARIESGNMEMQISTIALSDVVRLCCTQNSRLAASRNITLVRDDSCNRFKIDADSHHLLQVLNNLLSNAIKYNRQGGRVTLSAEASGHCIRIFVSDTGIGMTPEEQKQLFQPFNRLGAEMGAIEGVGIGLAVARRLVEAMHGSIGVDSEPGTGSTFRVELPGTAIQTAKLPHILVVEDYLPNRNVLRMQLQTLGCKVDMASNGAEALTKYRATSYDLILSDLNMPVMDGLALALAVREDEKSSGRHIPIIAITAAAVDAELKNCRTAGMDDTLTKPIALEGLRSMLARWLGMTSVTFGQTTIADDNAILNLDHLYHNLGKIDPAQAQNLIATFISATGEGLARAESGDSAAVSREMHKQKSSARTVGALRYAQLAEALEQQTREEQTIYIEASLTALRAALQEVAAAACNLHETPFAGPVATTSFTTLKCVLVIDDDPVVVQQMSSLLATLGVPLVLNARNGLEAMKVLLANKGGIELLLCDLNMPEMDGVELIRNIGKTGFDGGVILISGADEKVLATVSRLAGLQGLCVLGQLRKPVVAAQIAPLLSLSCKVPDSDRPAFVAPVITQDDIIAGMEGGEFLVWLQPKVVSSSLRTVGVEALARWIRQDGNFVPPDIFITVAEQTGLIGKLSQMLLAAALNEGAKLRVAGFPLKIAINLSGRWLNDLSLPDFILARTLSAGLQAEDVILEVTETGVLEDLTTALDVLTRLRIKGFGLSIDDFGIGYSSFEQLGRIPFTEMKLDRSFVSKGSQDAAARAILESSMDMAHKLGLSTVAEGVETEADLELMRTLGCDLLQGYLIAKPMPTADLINWLHKNCAENGAM